MVEYTGQQFQDTLSLTLMANFRTPRCGTPAVDIIACRAPKESEAATCRGDLGGGARTQIDRGDREETDFGALMSDQGPAISRESRHT